MGLKLVRDTSICPFCGSDDVHYHGLDDGGGDDGESIVTMYKCETCQAIADINDFDYMETEEADE